MIVTVEEVLLFIVFCWLSLKSFGLVQTPNQYQYKSFYSYNGLIQAAKYNEEYNSSNKFLE